MSRRLRPIRSQFMRPGDLWAERVAFFVLGACAGAAVCVALLAWFRATV